MDYTLTPCEQLLWNRGLLDTIYVSESLSDRYFHELLSPDVDNLKCFLVDVTDSWQSNIKAKRIKTIRICVEDNDESGFTENRNRTYIVFNDDGKIDLSFFRRTENLKISFETISIMLKRFNKVIEHFIEDDIVYCSTEQEAR